MDIEKPFLLIPDLQIPFENPKALYFCSYLKRHYSIPDENCICLGDETDQVNFSQYTRDPNGYHTAGSEIKASRIILKEWVSVFPKMMVNISNHGMRIWRKASAAEIPSEVIRTYHEIFDLPQEWVFKDRWEIPTKKPFQTIHGMEISGKHSARQAAELFGVSTCFGHLHSSAGIAYVNNGIKDIFGFNVGCLISPDEYAFQYGKYSRYKPNLGAGIIFNKGSTPIFFPLDSF